MCVGSQKLFLWNATQIVPYVNWAYSPSVVALAFSKPEQLKNLQDKTECWGPTFLPLFLMLTQEFGPVTEPLCASVSSFAKWGLNAFFYKVLFAILEQEVLKVAQSAL